MSIKKDLYKRIILFLCIYMYMYILIYVYIYVYIKKNVASIFDVFSPDTIDKIHEVPKIEKGTK